MREVGSSSLTTGAGGRDVDGMDVLGKSLKDGAARGASAEGGGRKGIVLISSGAIAAAPRKRRARCRSIRGLVREPGPAYALSGGWSPDRTSR